MIPATTDHRIAQRLSNFRPGTGPEHERHPSQQGAERGHENGTKAQPARLVNGVLAGKPAFTLADERKVDQHDAVLLHDTDQQDNANDTNDIEASEMPTIIPVSCCGKEPFGIATNRAPVRHIVRIMIVRVIC